MGIKMTAKTKLLTPDQVLAAGHRGVLLNTMDSSLVISRDAL
jgi:hypothetical protein